MNYQSLTTTLENQPGVTYSEVTDGYPVIHIKNNAASASIALHGAHLIDFKPNGEKPVIFTSESAIYREGKAIRGGIPICWPYFNAHPTHSNFPSHGIARNRFWNLVSIEAEQHCHSLTFEMPISEEDQLLIGGTLVRSVPHLSQGSTVCHTLTLLQMKLRHTTESSISIRNTTAFFYLLPIRPRFMTPPNLELST